MSRLADIVEMIPKTRCNGIVVEPGALHVKLLFSGFKLVTLQSKVSVSYTHLTLPTIYSV